MNDSDNPIYVTQPSLPSLEEYTELLKQIWSNKIITNNGPFHQKFEEALAEYLGVKYISVFSNGTLALMTALQTMRITGEVITTPFSFVATTHALWWNNIKPVFSDIENKYFNLDPERVEAAITPRTAAIMPVHVYGTPCYLEQFQQIAEIYGLKLIYDAAHSFGVRINGDSILNFGDLSVLSFHATKVFNTVEGGAIVCHDEKTKKRIDLLKNFGFKNEVTVIAPGINAKMNELQAAFGILQLKHIDKNIEARKNIALVYKKQLREVPGVSYLQEIDGVDYTYSYFPILINKEEYGMNRNELYEKLRLNNIYSRRYFYPLISQFPTYKGLPSAKPENLPVASKIAEQVICLPIYPNLQLSNIHKIVKIIEERNV